MKDSFFVDSNIFLYAFCDKDLDKQIIASKIIQDDSVISTQVINEVSNNLLKKLMFSNNEIENFIKSCYLRYTIMNFSQEVFILASNVREKYAISYYDSLIVATALTAEVKFLYSEDMQHNQIINKQLTIINPFT